MIEMGDPIDITITRFEASFDRACDEAHRQAIVLFNIDKDGHSGRVRGWERNRCWIDTRFVDYCRSGDTHYYNFTATAMQSEEDDDDE